MDENEFFRHASLRVCGHLDIAEAMRSTLDYFQGILPADQMYLQLYEPELGSMRTIAMATTSEAKQLDALAPLPQAARTQIEQAASLDLPDVVIMNRPEESPVARAMYAFHGVQDKLGDSSLLLLLLIPDGKVLGELVVIAEGGVDRYSDLHAQLLSTLREPFVVAMSNTLEHRKVLRLEELLRDDNRYLQRELLQRSGEEVVGAGFGLAGVMEMVRQVATLDSPVLLLGETGVGKDVIANAIHYSSLRRDGPFIVVNCGAIPDSLLDSELFGHEKGAFTGALSQKRGRFERAHGGTIFLDEIGELPPEAQVRLLRVLQSKQLERVGGAESIDVDIRVIAATNRELEEMVRSHRFREDLWFRLNVFPIVIPSLRERKADIPALVQHFIALKTKELKLRAVPQLAPGAIDRLTGYHWPGNVRELQNIIERTLILDRSGPLAFEHLGLISQDPTPPAISTGQDKPLDLDAVVAKHIRRVLDMTKGKIHGAGGAAELLGVNASTLRNRMNKLGIRYGRTTQPKNV